MDILQKSENNQRRIGLTGGIASGKTTITNYIRKHKNIPILDADNLSRELIKPNTYGYKKILDYFGNKILDRNPILIKLSQQGHCMNNLNLYEILLKILNDENG